MYTGALKAISTDGDWVESFKVEDDLTDDLVDLSSAIIVMKMRDAETNAIVLSATTADNTITIEGTGIFQWSFTSDQLGALCAKTYRIGVTVEVNDTKYTLLNATIPVLDGAAR